MSMRESTLVEMMKAFAQHWQDHMNEGVLPEGASVQIMISRTSITVSGLQSSPDAERCLTLFDLRKNEDETWKDQTQRMNELWKEDGMLYEPSKEQQPAGEGGKET